MLHLWGRMSDAPRNAAEDSQLLWVLTPQQKTWMAPGFILTSSSHCSHLESEPGSGIALSLPLSVNLPYIIFSKRERISWSCQWCLPQQNSLCRQRSTYWFTNLRSLQLRANTLFNTTSISDFFLIILTEMTQISCSAGCHIVIPRWTTAKSTLSMEKFI